MESYHQLSTNYVIFKKNGNFDILSVSEYCKYIVKRVIYFVSYKFICTIFEIFDIKKLLTTAILYMFKIMFWFLVCWLNTKSVFQI